MKERKQIPDWLCGLIIFLIFLIVAGGSLVFCVVYPQKRYEKICSNVPSESWFEQDLKVIFYDKEINILDIESNENGKAIVKVEVHYGKGEKEKIVHYCYYEVEEGFYDIWQWKYQETL